ncbi:TatD family hydrolase [Jiulongibacter sediminis]|jgi:TatD DNase family protein|uniref:TatD family hydrolase n=1 Tax=Jiulongibacter sediminis TaxID=1605367 RepID=UPI0026F0B98C|nr:TatD family hydrolase [Jiulongibacter sediminis]
MSSDFVNIHCHSVETGVPFSVLNQYVDIDLRVIPLMEEAAFRSIGIHPWYMNEASFEKQFDFLKKEVFNRQYFALGECGLDRVNGPAFDFQKEVLLAQMELSQRHKLPVVLHLVKSYSDILQIRKKFSSDSKLIIHGFSGNALQVLQLTEAGFYLSFGTALFNPNKKLKEAFLACPHDRLFLETDTSETSISEVYKSASKWKEVPIEELVSQLKLNFDKLK